MEKLRNPPSLWELSTSLSELLIFWKKKCSKAIENLIDLIDKKVVHINSRSCPNAGRCGAQEGGVRREWCAFHFRVLPSLLAAVIDLGKWACVVSLWGAGLGCEGWRWLLGFSACRGVRGLCFRPSPPLLVMWPGVSPCTSLGVSFPIRMEVWCWLLSPAPS